jgi:hypothetical protein
MGLRSGIRKKPIPDPEVKKAPDLGSTTLIFFCPTKQEKLASKYLIVQYGPTGRPFALG